MLRDAAIREQAEQDKLADIAMWKELVKSRGRETDIDQLVRGHVCTWLGADVDHKLFIRVADGVKARKHLGFYSDSELGEWFALMTTLVLVQTISQVGMQWKLFGINHPVILMECPPLSVLRRTPGVGWYKTDGHG